MPTRKKHNNRLKYPSNTTTRAKITLLPVSDAILNFWVKESPDKVSTRTIEKLTPENMGIAFGILALGGTKPEIHLGGHLPPPNCNVRFKKYHCNTRFKKIVEDPSSIF